ncbi:MAG: DUF975 family protein [Candidatus Gastranaerophilales bacterium]|nr:DUF975 family protein [Candidatus Gastranaerophilales bacterium]
MNQHTKISDLKNNAKGLLDGRWRTPVLAAFLSTAICFALEALFIVSMVFWTGNGMAGKEALYYVILFVFSFLLSILSTLLEIGSYFLLLKLISGQAYSVSDLFMAFCKDPGRSVTVVVMATLLRLVCLLPYYICSYLFQHNPILFLSFLMFVCLIAGFAVYIPLTLSLCMSPLLLLDFPQYSASDILRYSARIMNGNKGRLFLLELSFLPLNILCVFSFGIGNLWLMPYMQTTIVLFYLDIIKAQQTTPFNS